MTIKTAILGYGRSGSTLHADPIEYLPDYDLTAVCDIDPKALEKASKRFGCRLYEDYKLMLKEEKDLELVIIVTRSEQHCHMVCDCLRAGKNVLITKPWALNSDEAMMMITASKESRKLLLPWLPARFANDLTRAKEIIDTGVIGKVFQVRRGEYSFGLRNDWQTMKKYGGGYLLNWGPHLVDQPLQLIGKPIKSVYGELKQINNPGDVEDVFYAVIKTEDNVTVITEWNITTDLLPNWVIQGNRGTVYITANKIEIHKVNLPDCIGEKDYRAAIQVVKTTEELDEKNLIGMHTRYGDPLLIYPVIAQAIRGEIEYPISLESALGLTNVLDAIRKSSETGQVVMF